MCSNPVDITTKALSRTCVKKQLKRKKQLKINKTNKDQLPVVYVL